MNKESIIKKINNLRWKNLSIFIKLTDEFYLYFPDDVLWDNNDLINYVVDFMMFLKEKNSNQFDLGPIRIKLLASDLNDVKLKFIIDEFPKDIIQRDNFNLENKLLLLRDFAVKKNYQNLVIKIDDYFTKLNHIKMQ